MPYQLLDEEQWAKLIVWVEKQDDKVKALHGEKPGYPYGASGGAYTYSFTPTNLGLVATVRNNLTHEEIDLTNYGYW